MYLEPTLLEVMDSCTYSSSQQLAGSGVQDTWEVGGVQSDDG